jgi:NAD(P)-dependent dehydrogenase (short-subunit alcohol dehydrogenase family)
MSFEIQKLFGIAGKIALVTGGTRGIGRILAEGFVRNGAKTYITGRQQADADRVAGELSRFGEAYGLQADLSTLAGVRALTAAFAEREPRLDILMNNAGMFLQATLDDYSEKQYDDTFNLNTKAPFFLTQALLPQLRAAATEQSPARVVNMASGAGQFVGAQAMHSYGGAKAALIHLTRSMAAELAKDNIRVNAVTPGVVITEVSEKYLADHGGPLFASMPTGRATSGEEIAGTVIYLCSAAGANTTGQTISADGGQTVMPVVRAS